MYLGYKAFVFRKRSISGVRLPTLHKADTSLFRQLEEVLSMSASDIYYDNL